MLHRILAAVLVVTALLPLSRTAAQPVLTFSRIVNNWPTIELYYKAGCDGEPYYPYQKQLLRVYDNGNEIREFTTWCPDPNQRCALSTALVLDASVSAIDYSSQMKSDAITFLKLTGKTIDASTILQMQSTTTVIQGITTDKDALSDAIEGIPSSGGSAVWDGIYKGLEELIANGSNPCRGVLVFTDGYDNGSTHTMDEVIALANRNRIRVFTFGYEDVNEGGLQTVAALTGGEYTYAPGYSDIQDVYMRLSTILFSGFLECLITYQASCMDGALHTVELTLANACGGTDTKTRTYRAPQDSGQYYMPPIALGESVINRGAECTLPLEFLTDPGPMTSMVPSSFTVHYQPTEMEFLGVETLPGTLLNGMNVTWYQIQGGARIVVPDTRSINAAGTLMDLRFRVLAGAQPGDMEITIDSVAYSEGCWRPFTASGTIHVVTDTPVIVADSPPRLCRGETVTLTCSDGFSDFRWSTGETTKSIVVTTAGQYTVEAENGFGAKVISAPIEVLQLYPEQPHLNQSQGGLCSTEAVRIWTDLRWDDYRWSTGGTGHSILVDTPGVYYCEVLNPYGCWTVSDTVHVVAGSDPVPSIRGPLTVCKDGAQYTYVAEDHSGSAYSWDITEGQILSGKDSIAVTVLWDGQEWGTLRLLETNTRTGCKAQDTADIRLLKISPALNVPVAQVCTGGTVTLSAGAGYDSYHWNTGDTTESITVSLPGQYWCDLTLDICSGTTDTASITAIPPIDGTISGNAQVCENEIVSYTVPYYDTDYKWTVEGGEVLHGIAASSIDVRWTAPGQGLVTCFTRVGGCTDYDTLDITIAAAEDPELTISGELEFCDGDSVVFIAEPGFVSYTWSNGATGPSIAVDSTGEYYVAAENANGCLGYSDTISVLRWLFPVKPTIVQHDSTLTIGSHPAYLTYTWYLNGEQIPASGGTITITETGTYTLEITNDGGCTTVCDPYNVTTLGARIPPVASRFSISPNPSNGVFEVALEFEHPTAFGLRIVNALGQTVYSEYISERVDKYNASITLPHAPPGVYIFLLQGGGRYDYKKIVLH